MAATDGMVELKDVIEKLRTELEQAVDAGRGKALQFELEGIDVELQVGITDKLEGNLGLKLWVYELGAKGAMERATTQTVRLKLKPRAKNGGPTTISSRE